MEIIEKDKRSDRRVIVFWDGFGRNAMAISCGELLRNQEGLSDDTNKIIVVFCGLGGG